MEDYNKLFKELNTQYLDKVDELLKDKQKEIEEMQKKYPNKKK
jgi:hypothetical protein